MPAVAIQPSPAETATQTVAISSPEANVTRAEIALRQTGAVPIVPGVLLAATGTAGARAIATQQAIDASTIRQAAGILDCNTIDFEILQPPIEVRTLAGAVVPVELRWRVRNKATEPVCQWGQAGEESKILSATLVGGTSGASTPVKLKWLQDNEYDLSLDVQLSPGCYVLSWRLMLPKTGLPEGPALQARVGDCALTAYPTPTLTLTPCPSITYPCHCTKECSGRTCETVCDTCTREVCD